MRVFVTGATGVAGRRSVRALVEQGHEVTAVARSAAKANLISSLGAVASNTDIFDATAVVSAIQGHDAVVNLATRIPPYSKAMLPGAWAENDHIRSQASRILVDAALSAGATRYIQESMAFMYPDRGTEWIDEDVEVSPPPHVRTALVGEANAARFSASGGAGVVLRFGQFYAADAAHTRSTIKLARRHICPLPGPPEAFFPMIQADDVGGAVVAALKTRAGIYNVVDDEPMPQRRIADALSAALGIRRLRFPPPAMARLGGEKVKMLMRSQRVSNHRFRDVTGWRPSYPSVREGFGAMLKEGEVDAKR